MLFLYIVLGIVAIVIILILAAPKKYQVSRSIQINRPISEVFEYLKYIKNQDAWSPWLQRDPDMKRTETGEDGTIGFTSRWESDHKQVGTGEQELKLIIPDERIESELRFLKPWKSVSNGFFTVRKVDANITDVTWGFYGVNKPPMNVFMLFFNMEKAVGADFEEGLAALKRVMEAQENNL